MRKCFILMLSIILGACRAQNDGHITVLHPLKETIQVDNLSDYLTVDDLVKIPDNELISDISKILLTSEDNMVLLDVQKRIFSLDRSSNSLSLILNRGRAANEYLMINDIAITDDDELILLDDNRLHNVDILNNRIISTMRLPDHISVDAIAPASEDSYYIFSAFPLNPKDFDSQSGYLLYRINSDNSIAEFIPREDCTFSLFNISQSSGNEYYLRPQSSDGIFYRLEEQQVVPWMQVDFDNMTMPSRYYFDSANKDIAAYMMSKYYKLPMELMLTNDNIYFHSCGPNAEDYSFLYSRHSIKGIRWQNISDSNLAKVLACDETGFYVVVNYLGGEDKNRYGALTKYVLDYLEGRNAEQDRTYLVKIRCLF